MKKQRAKAKPKEPTITKGGIMEAVKEATKKPIPDKVDKNKEMVTCPDCGLSITQHNLKYTHQRYCKALKEKEQEEPASSSTHHIPIAQKAKPLMCPITSIREADSLLGRVCKKLKTNQHFNKKVNSFQLSDFLSIINFS